MPISAAYQCQSVLPISLHQYHLTVPPVPPISASQCRLSVPVSAAYQCHISVPCTSASSSVPISDACQCPSVQ
ncbi:unnamed protein product, partial [Staurois parvus]